MTWVIGMRGLLSRGILIGDTRVTLADRQGRPVGEFDGVVKIHALANNIAVGFAGNIDTGFRMVDDLRMCLRNSIPHGAMTNEPSRFILWWARRARWAWRERLTAREREGKCALLYVAARPPVSPINVTPNVAYVLRSPDFVPELAPRLKAVAIGSGNEVDEYAAELEAISQERNELIAFDNEVWAPMGGPLIVLSAVLGERIREVAAPGISHHLVLCSVEWGQLLFGTNEGVGFDSAHHEERWPSTIARTWPEWQQVKKRRGLGDLRAVA